MTLNRLQPELAAGRLSSHSPTFGTSSVHYARQGGSKNLVVSYLKDSSNEGARQRQKIRYQPQLCRICWILISRVPLSSNLENIEKDNREKECEEDEYTGWSTAQVMYTLWAPSQVPHRNPDQLALKENSRCRNGIRDLAINKTEKRRRTGFLDPFRKGIRRDLLSTPLIADDPTQPMLVLATRARIITWLIPKLHANAALSPPSFKGAATFDTSPPTSRMCKIPEGRQKSVLSRRQLGLYPQY